MNQLQALKRRGFSFIEFCAVSTIVGVIAAIVVPRVVVDDKLAKEKIRDHHVAAINAAVERYHSERQAWPADLQQLSSEPKYLPDGLPVNPLTGRPFKLNPRTHRVE